MPKIQLNWWHAGRFTELEFPLELIATNLTKMWYLAIFTLGSVLKEKDKDEEQPQNSLFDII